MPRIPSPRVPAGSSTADDRCRRSRRQMPQSLRIFPEVSQHDAATHYVEPVGRLRCWSVAPSGPCRPVALQPAGPVRDAPRWSVAPSGPSWPGGLPSGRRRAGRAGCGRLQPVAAQPAYAGAGRTGLLGTHRPTASQPGYWGFARGEPGPVSRRGWRAEGQEARERESSSEPRQDAEANVRRNGSGSPRACCRAEQAMRARLKPVEAGCSATGLRRCGTHRPTGDAPACAGAGRTGLLATHRPTGGSRVLRRRVRDPARDTSPSHQARD
jgi:hypothetical protein